MIVPVGDISVGNLILTTLNTKCICVIDSKCAHLVSFSLALIDTPIFLVLQLFFSLVEF